MFLVIGLVGAPFHAEPAIRPGQTVTVQDIDGRIRVRAGSRLIVDARKYAERSDPNAVVVRVEPGPSGVVVCVRYPPDTQRSCAERVDGPGEDDTRVDFDVTVPADIGVVAANVNGSVDVVTDGHASASNVNGSVHVDARDVDAATTVNGSVRVRVRDRSTAPLRATSVNGRVEVELPPGSGVTLDASTLNGEIDAGGLPVQRPPFGPGARVHGVLGDGARPVELHSVNGSLTLRR
jgi:hypothetical protein